MDRFIVLEGYTAWYGEGYSIIKDGMTVELDKSLSLLAVMGRDGKILAGLRVKNGATGALIPIKFLKFIG